MPTKLCRRNHPMTASNTRLQRNRYTRKGEKRPRVFLAKVCIKCANERQARTNHGIKNKDMRKGRRG